MQTKVATGNIAPSRFVKIDTAGPGKVAQAGSGERAYGISQPGTRNTPYSSLDDGYAAISGENVGVFTTPDGQVKLELGGTVDEGDFLKSDTNGKGVKADTDVDEYCAQAETSGVSGELIYVRLIGPGQLSI